ncbi:UDP-glucose 4-epimerase GalE [Roseospira navarrensis]|uniref:UDP-glucose 4-epimerase n=1 Tax=Roseospira navarrensis TaxID=140058 RepID=A0A7X1ZD58_9PROT|nr:UDP-glucose 4-epimerase GalE [Roseospira navarrensis]MQX36374.1 UDP-glucose 4-epimerase GalE [Roseospira navarrensis]
MTAVLVTGGAGYIGSHVCKELHRRGVRPVVLDSLCNGHRAAVKWGPLCLADIADTEAVRAVVREHRPVAVIHMAGFIHVGESVAAPGQYWRNNVGGSLALVEALLAEGVRHVVFSSTCAVYGVPDALPIPETAALHPINPYGHTKLVVESILRDFRQAHGLQEVCLRYFNAAGADPDGEIGEMHDPEPHLVPNILRAITGGRSVFDLMGDDYDTRDGTCIRDYVHVTDLARVHVDALDYLISGGAPLALNLGTGQGHTVREVVAAVERITGRTVPVRVLSRRPGDPPELVANASNAARVLGFRPTLSDLDTIAGTAWRWHQSVRASRPAAAAAKKGAS